MTGSGMNPPFQRLLLASEHTDYDAGAERVALALAARCGLPLSAVLPIASNPEYEAVAPQLAERADALAAGRLAGLRADAAAAGVALDSRVRRGPELDQEIVDEARAQASDLIVIRRRGQRGFLARLLVGEMVTRVVAHAPCSVLLVPRAAALWSRGVLLALNPDAPPSRRAALTATAIAVARECGLPLTVVCVSDGSGATLMAAELAAQQAVAVAQRASVAAQAEVAGGREHEQIVAVADRQGADLIVMGRHDSALAGRAWLGGTTQKVIGLAERPVLVAIPKESTA